MSGEGFGDNLVENIDQNLTENDKQLGEEEIWGDQTIGATLSALVTSGQQATSIPIFTNSSAESSNIKEAATKDQIASSLNQLLAMQSGNPRKISETHRSRSRSNERKHISSSIANSAALAAAAQQSGTNPPVVIIPITTVIPPTKGLEESADDDKQDDEKSQSKQYLRMRGLPFNARERELFEFLGFSLESDQLSFRHDSQGRFCGECVIKSSDQKQFDRIMQMHMRNMGKRYIEVFPADQNDFLRSQESQFIDDDDDKNNADGSSYDPEFLWSIGIVKIRGLPYDSNDMDIQQFFKDSQIIPNGIQKVFDGRRPSGEAFILFSTRADATKALEKDKQRMGSRYIEVFLCHPKEYTNHIKRRKEIQEGGGGYGGGGYGGNVGGYGGRYERGGGYGGYGGYNGYGGGYQHSYQQGSSQYGGGGGNGGYPRGNDSRYGGGGGGSNSSSGYASRYGSSPPRGGAAIGPASGAPGGYYKKGPASTMGGNSTNGYYDRGQNGGYNRMQGGNGGGMNSGRYQNDSRQPSNNYKKDDYNRSYGDYDQRQQQQQQQPQQHQSSSSSYNAPAPMVNSNTYGSTQYQDPTTSVPSGNVGQQQPYYYGSQQTSTQQQQYTYPTSNYTSGTTTGYGTTSSTSNSITDPSAAVQAQGYSYAAQTATTQPNYHSQYSSYYPAQQAQQPDSSAGYYAQQPQTSAATTQASSYYTQSSVKTGGYSYQHQ